MSINLLTYLLTYSLAAYLTATGLPIDSDTISYHFVHWLTLSTSFLSQLTTIH